MASGKSEVRAIDLDDWRAANVWPDMLVRPRDALPIEGHQQ